MLRFTQDETQIESFKMRLFKNTKARSNAGWNFHKLVAPIDLVKPPGGFKNTDAIHGVIIHYPVYNCNLLREM